MKDEQELRPVAAAVAYEVTMMWVAHQYLRGVERRPLLRPDATEEERQFLQNALVENVLLHGRQLLDFLFPRANKRGTDAYAADYQPDWNEDATDLRFGGEDIAAVRDSIDKHLAHVTLARGASREWPMKFVEDLLRQFQVFYESLPTDRQTWFGPGLAHFFS